MTQMHFIAGLPRSGSTLLAAILRQNPVITASMSSPVGGIFSAVQKAISRGNEAAMFLSDEQRERLLRNVFWEVYREPLEVLPGDGERPQWLGQHIDEESLRIIDDYGQPVPRVSSGKIVFDTNRMWPAKLPVLVKLFPECRVICCVRRVSWIMDSIERLLRRNALELSGIFGFEPGGTVYSRVVGLASSNGLVGFAVDALRDGFYGEHRDRMILVEYEALARHPGETVRALYRWLGLPYYEGHDYERVDQIPGAAEFDEKLGTPGLHSVRRRVEWQERESILPPELFTSFPAPFWRTNNPRVMVIHCEPETVAKAA